MKKNTGFIFYGAIIAFSLIFIFSAISLNENYYAGVVNQPLIITIGACMIGLAFFELYKRTFEKRHAISTAILCSISVIFLIVVFPSYNYTEAGEQLMNEYENEGHQVALEEVITPSFVGNEQPTLFISRYYVHSVTIEDEDDSYFYFVDPSSGETLRLETFDE